MIEKIEQIINEKAVVKIKLYSLIYSIEFINNRYIIYADYYNKNIKAKMNDYKLSVDDKKKILNEFLNKIPNKLMILRNHIKNCLYVNTISDLNFKIKSIEEDFKRLSYIK